jgi:16S rRNA (guanine527-N7)-methyltransferase
MQPKGQAREDVQDEQRLSAMSDEEALRAAAQALGLQLSALQLRQLMAFRDALLKWNKVYNLTALRQPQEMLQQHLIDCLAIVPPVQRELAKQHATGFGVDDTTSILDVGSGGGLPGVVLAVLLPHCRIDCVDAVAKKVAFVRQVAAELGLSNLSALHSRVEDLKPPGRLGQGYDLITSRAFASLPDFTSWTKHLLAAGGSWAAMKGKRPDDELGALIGVQVFHVEPLNPPGMQAQRCLVWMKAFDTVASANKIGD